MARASSKDEPIAIVGTGLAGMAALINTLADIAYNTPEDAPTVNIWLIDTRDEARAKGATVYPLSGNSAKDLHPFYTDKPPTGFPTFGDYIEGFSKEDASLRTALVAPTYRQVKEYLQYVLELAIVTIADKAILDVSKADIQEIQQTTQDGPATILFKDGTSLNASRVIHARPAPHMGGLQSK